MAGNTWELVDEAMTASEGALTAFAELLSPRPTAGEPWCMIRGGSYQYPLIPVHEFGRIPERYRADDIGFRCVRDVK
jgi:formylglycine-generating enzyme required for sulfatase activity